MKKVRKVAKQGGRIDSDKLYEIHEGKVSRFERYRNRQFHMGWTRHGR